VGTALVTGGCGFIGRHLTTLLAQRGYGVRVLDLQDWPDAPAGVEIRKGSILDRATMAGAVEGVQLVFHLAANPNLWAPDPRTFHEVNYEGTCRVLEASAKAGVERIVYTSSVATLGLPLSDDMPANEQTPVNEGDIISPYKQSKYAAEALVKRMVKDQGLPAVIVHPSTPIGPRDVKPTPTGKIVVEAARGRMPAFVDTGLNLVHVDDVAQGHVLALERGQVGENYILGGQDVSLAEMLATIAHQVGRKPPTIRVPQAPLVPLAWVNEQCAKLFGYEPFLTLDGLRMSGHHMFYTSSKAEAALGYRARPYEQAIADAIAWFRGAGMIR